jgi:hypothetical protein
MKTRFFFTLFVLFIANALLFGQSVRLIENRSIPMAKERASDILQKCPANVSVDFVTINKEHIIKAKQFSVEFGDRQMEVSTERVELRGDNTTVTIWSDGGVGNRMDPLYNNNVTDTLLLLVTKTDLLENSLYPQCEPYEQLNDYMTMTCSYSVLKLSNGTVSGRITDSYQETTMLWADFAKQFEITK